MINNMREKTDRESGVVVVEATFVVVIAILIFFFTVNVSVVYHNRLVATAVANEAASGVAEVYGCVGKEPFYAYTDSGYFKGRNIYRYLDERLSAESGELALRLKINTSAEEKGKWYASYLISHTEFNSADKARKMNFDDIVVECGKSEHGINVLTVTIKREYPVFIMNPVSFFGLDPTYTVKAKGTAVCYDVIHQINAVSFAREVNHRLLPSKSIGETMGETLELINRIVTAMDG